MNLIAIRESVEVVSPNSTVRTVTFGNPIGDFSTNKNDGTILLKTGELVDSDSVAILVDNNGSAITPTSFGANLPKQNAVKDINPEAKKEKIRRIIALCLLTAGTVLIFKGRKSIGITAVVFGFIMLKRNQNTN